jgi:hypothetical protein
VRDGRVVALRAGEFQVARPDDRRRAMHERVGGTSCPLLTLSEVNARDAEHLRRSIAQARLVVVHSTEIDEAGENGSGVAVFELVMQRLQAAWTLLREAGVQRFVFTADHGFLLLDPTSHTVQSRGRKIDTKRRHLLTTIAADHPNEVRVPFTALGYEDQPDWHVVVPETTAVFDTNGGPGNFVHGGNSLQERVIPVLVVSHRIAAGASLLALRHDAEALMRSRTIAAAAVAAAAQAADARATASEQQRDSQSPSRGGARSAGSSASPLPLQLRSQQRSRGAQAATPAAALRAPCCWPGGSRRFKGRPVDFRED